AWDVDGGFATDDPDTFVSEHALALWGFGPEHVVAVGRPQQAWILEDGTWSPVAVTPADVQSYDLTGVWGATADDIVAVGWAVEAGGVAFRAVDGGAFEPDPLPPPRDLSRWPNLRAVWGRAASEIYAVGDAGTILRRGAGGWVAMDSGTTHDLTGVTGDGDDVLVVGDAGTILRLVDGTWVAEDAGTTARLVSVWGGGGEVFAGGEPSVLLHKRGGRWSRVRTDLPSVVALVDLREAGRDRLFLFAPFEQTQLVRTTRW
ncbi:MAG TPA: hypothetical protein VMZ28_07540, partial [Kofleriaceae bacterium]|nr:hypothetical protein [Kofleriaceae bacterium]